MIPTKPQRSVLTIWRIVLSLIMLAPAFLNSLFFGRNTLVWTLLTVVWVIVFLGFYLFYLPVRYRKLSFRVDKEKITLNSGILCTRVHAIPLQNIQFTSTLQSPFGRMFGVCTLIVTAAGGRMLIPGLREQDAQNLAAILPQSWSE